MINRVPLIYGYCRASDPRSQCLSPERQHSQISERAQQIAKETGAKIAHCRIDGASARIIGFRDRPEFRKLMDEIERGDHLIVWRMDRLDKGLKGMVDAMQWCVDSEIHLHVLEHGNMQLDLDNYIGRALVGFMAVFASMESDRHSETITTALRWCKENGLAYHGRPAFGKRRIRRPPEKGQRRGLVMDVWDFRECAQIREIIRRHEAGESMISIGKDFAERGEKTANGKLWVKPAKRGKRLNCSRLYRVYKWHLRLCAEGKRMGYTLPE